ncbi:PREDICTED: sperm-tail PG-rich repeat-containing protein 2 [Elephantulus edwardii]|uniref:sperm-tail PG-rich repeat-containing protein 2 n=1 Tax=Elephantulus edwardii TaxID=28737 RepID=UPI0003F09BCF|nr:PREDICTED: sperm-tail PG-rich repeat-containing protein 2 [Elephantulus edwardii]
MYDRAPRLFRLSEGSSTENSVGPGSYQVPSLKPRAADGYAPFLSLATRESSFPVDSNAGKAVPGPGHYNVSKAQRMSRIPIVSRTVDVPSIPSFSLAYGYHINEDDTIIKRFPPSHDNTLGPAYYKPQYDGFSTTLKYKGVHFSNSLGRRELIPEAGPGPGHYDLVQVQAPHYENVNIKKEQQQNLCSSKPRFYDIILLLEEKKRFVPIKSITPAPGTYNETQTDLRSLKKILREKKSDVSAPGSYDVQKSYDMSHGKRKYMPPRSLVAKINHTSFLSSAPRWFEKIPEGPGPATYSPSLRKSCSIPLFLKTKRFEDVPKETTPGPTTYELMTMDKFYGVKFSDKANILNQSAPNS